MEQERPERPKRRKCGPRVKTGCITCRIRRVKCDEGKPNCQRCVSTGRKCDGYVTQQKSSNQRCQLRPNEAAVEMVQRPGLLIPSPYEHNDTQRSRQLFHFYCVQSAVDLSVYLNSGFWHNMILQYSHYHPVVRQAVVAFGSSHLYALSMNQNKVTAEANNNALEQVQQYDLAIRSLREYMDNTHNMDPHVVLICCALLFSCENSRGNREAAWQHLEKGLHILNSFENSKSKKLLKNEYEVSTELELVANKNGSKLKAKTDKVEIDEELVYVFSRLDVQATLCKETRRPVLDLEELSHQSISEQLNQHTIFTTITDAQRTLDYLHNRLARFLSNAANSQSQDPSLSTPEPDWVESERLELNRLCATWGTCMLALVNRQQPAVKQNLQSRHAPKLSGSPEWQMALQIQLLTLHHRCWWMLFRSYHNPTVFTASPNPHAMEILDICEFLGFALPVRPSAVYSATETDIAWKMISEIGVTAPLFALAIKCLDPDVRSRAVGQLTALRKHGNGMYHETFLDQVIKAVLQVTDVDRSPENIGDMSFSDSSPEVELHLQQFLASPTSEYDFPSEGAIQEALTINEDATSIEPDSGVLLGWSRASFSI